MSYLKPVWLISILLLTSACGGGDSSPSPASPPSSPVGISVTAGDGSNSIAWNPVDGASNYSLYWSTSSGKGRSGARISPVTSPYTHTGLSNGTTYYYVITATNSAGESTTSIEFSGTPAIQPPDAPSFQDVIPGDTQVQLSWNPVAGATSYNLYRSTTSGTARSGTLIKDVTSPYLDNGLVNDTSYY